MGANFKTKSIQWLYLHLILLPPTATHSDSTALIIIENRDCWCCWLCSKFYVPVSRFRPVGSSPNLGVSIKQSAECDGIGIFTPVIHLNLFIQCWIIRMASHVYKGHTLIPVSLNLCHQNFSPLGHWSGSSGHVLPIWTLEKCRGNNCQLWEHQERSGRFHKFSTTGHDGRYHGCEQLRGKSDCACYQGQTYGSQSLSSSSSINMQWEIITFQLHSIIGRVWLSAWLALLWLVLDAE